MPPVCQLAGLGRSLAGLSGSITRRKSRKSPTRISNIVNLSCLSALAPNISLHICGIGDGNNTLRDLNGETWYPWTEFLYNSCEESGSNWKNALDLSINHIELGSSQVQRFFHFVHATLIFFFLCNKYAMYFFVSLNIYTSDKFDLLTVRKASDYYLMWPVPLSRRLFCCPPKYVCLCILCE